VTHSINILKSACYSPKTSLTLTFKTFLFFFLSFFFHFHMHNYLFQQIFVSNLFHCSPLVILQWHVHSQWIRLLLRLKLFTSSCLSLLYNDHSHKWQCPGTYRFCFTPSYISMCICRDHSDSYTVSAYCPTSTLEVAFSDILLKGVCLLLFHVTHLFPITWCQNTQKRRILSFDVISSFMSNISTDLHLLGVIDNKYTTVRHEPLHKLSWQPFSS
jgi:hypothetical protein